jgi:CubicO group peptidase (beta-lactamase class C family)
MEVLVSVDPWETKPAKREITMRDLLTHTSGLGYTVTEQLGPLYLKHGIAVGLCTSDITLEDNMQRLALAPLLFHPGERWHYSMSTDVLGRIVKKVSGDTLDHFIEEAICRPLGMDDTSFEVPRTKLPRLVSAYIPSNSTIGKLDDNETITFHVLGGTLPLSSDYCVPQSNNKYLSGGAGLCSTAKDYIRFCQMLLNGGVLNGTRLLQQDTVSMMTTNRVGKLSDGFGLGFEVTPSTQNIHEQLRGSYSWGGFWSTSFRISPRGDWVVIAMSQVAPNDAAFQWPDQYEGIAAEAIEE